MKILRLIAVASAAFFIAGTALGQNAGSVTNHAFVIGKGAGQTGYTSLLCGSAQLAVGQSAADPICRTISGDITISASGVVAIGAGKVTSAMLNADVFSTAHTWSAAQTLAINQNAFTAWTVTNNSTGTAAAAGFNASNGSGSISIGVGGANYTAVAALQNRGYLYSTSALSGLVLWADGSNPTNFYNNGSLAGSFSGAGVFSLTTPLAVTSGGTGASSASSARTNLGADNASNISSGTLNTARLPSPFTSGTASGSTTKFATVSGTLTSGDCAKFDASGNVIAAGAPCGSGGGGTVYFDPGSINNCSLAASVSGGALTIALKTQAGVDPDASHICTVSFRNSTSATGDFTPVSVTAATSFSTATSGSTFGASNNVPFALYVTAWNNAGTVVLGLSRHSDGSGTYPLNESQPQSTTACSACGTATSAGVFYTTSALTTKALRVLGRLDWESGLTTAGTFASAPTRITLNSPGFRFPGDVIQIRSATFTTNVNTASTTPVNTGLNVSITPTSAVNLVQVVGIATLSQSTSAMLTHTRLARGGTFIGTSKSIYGTGGAFGAATTMAAFDLPGTTSSTNYTVQYWATGGLSVLNGAGGDGSDLSVTEIQG